MGQVLDTVGHAVGGVVKGAGNIINKVPGGQYIGDALAIATLNPELAALSVPAINGASTYAKTGNVGSGLLSAGGSYLGSSIGNALGGSLGTVGGALDKGFNAIGAGNVGNFVGNTLGSIAPSVANVGIGSALGGYVGNNLAQGLAPQKSPSNAGASGASLTAPPYTPTQASAQSLPASLSSFGGLDPQQQATNIANQGVYGGGNGPKENDYFLNLENRRLVDQGGNTQNMNTLQPIEQSYLNQLGLGGYSNTNDLLHAMSTWQSGAIH